MDAIRTFDGLLQRGHEIRFVIENHNTSYARDMVQLLDGFVKRQGLTGIGSQWVEVVRPTAARHLANVLRRDLAYKVELMSLDRAEELAECFLSLFPAARFFTNTVPHDPEPDGTRTCLSGWMPVTNATFDSGLIAVGQITIGLIWVEDED